MSKENKNLKFQVVVVLAQEMSLKRSGYLTTNRDRVEALCKNLYERNKVVKLLQISMMESEYF